MAAAAGKVVAIIGEQHLAHAEPVVEIDHADIAVEGVHAFDVEGDCKLTLLAGPGDVLDRFNLDQRVRFRPSTPFDERMLTELAEVLHVTWTGPRVTVSGTGDLLQAVTGALARNQIVAHELRVEQADLDDAFVALTGHGSDGSAPGDSR